MVWAMDQVDQTVSNGLSPNGDITSAQQDDAQQMSDDQQAKMSCRVSDCGDDRPTGTIEVTQTNGQPG